MTHEENMHTPEPWKMADKGYQYLHGIGNCCAIYATDGSGIVAFVFKKEGVENARRIVAAVNACKGISTEMLEEAHTGLTIERNRLRQQNAKLVEALETALAHGINSREGRDKVRAALAKHDDPDPIPTPQFPPDAPELYIEVRKLPEHLREQIQAELSRINPDPDHTKATIL